MSDDLSEMLGGKEPRPRDPRAHFGPRVRGGPPLSGGPKLDVGELPAAPPEEVAEPAKRAASGATKSAAGAAKSAAGSTKKTSTPTQGGSFRTLDAVHATRRPHITIPPPLVASVVPEADAMLAQSTRTEVVQRAEAAGHRGSVLEVIGLKKSFRKGAVTIPVLRGVDLAVRPGEFLAVVGQSGSGKSTLLHLLGTLDAPQEGEIRFEGRRIDNLPTRQRDALRNRRFGMIFQFYHLLPELDMLENVLVPMMIGCSTLGYLRRRGQYRQRAVELLELVGLGHRLKHKPRELSGGEMQRTAIARALVGQPDLLLADEPTGNLDLETGREILDVLRQLNRQQELTIVMVTHDQGIAESADRVVRLVDGRLA